MRNTVLWICILLVLLTAFPALAQVNKIYGCTEITSSGYYELAQNISGLLSGQKYCIGIFSDSVVLDGRGFSITGLRGGESIVGILIQARNVTVTNVNVSEYSSGIKLEYSNSNTIENNKISQCFRGIELFDSYRNNIRNNTITSGYGIWLSFSSSNNIENNMISRSLFGIHVIADSSYNTIKNNSISDNAIGIDIGYSNYNTIANNTISDSHVDGFRLLKSYSNTIANNIFVNSDLDIEESSNNRFENNYVNGKPFVYHERPSTDGFEAVSALVGLITVANLLRKRN